MHPKADRALDRKIAKIQKETEHDFLREVVRDVLECEIQMNPGMSSREQVNRIEEEIQEIHFKTILSQTFGNQMFEQLGNILHGQATYTPNDFLQWAHLREIRVRREGAGSGLPRGYTLRFPQVAELVIRKFCPPGGKILDPFAADGTVGAVAHAMGRQYVGLELNTDYLQEFEKGTPGAHPKTPSESSYCVRFGSVFTTDLPPNHFDLAFLQIDPWGEAERKWKLSMGFPDPREAEYVRNEPWAQTSLKAYLDSAAATCQETAKLIKPGGHMAILSMDVKSPKGRTIPCNRALHKGIAQMAVTPVTPAACEGPVIRVGWKDWPVPYSALPGLGKTAFRTVAEAALTIWKVV